LVKLLECSNDGTQSHDKLLPETQSLSIDQEWGLRCILDHTEQQQGNDIAVEYVRWTCHIVSFAQMCVSSIIAVHGLGANPEHAWVRHRDEAKNIKADVRWLVDLLPETLRAEEPRILPRIFCFNYQSAWLGSCLSKNRLENVAERLLDELYHARLKVSHAGVNSNDSPSVLIRCGKDDLDAGRPIIFIGHSFGGIVIEQAVVTARLTGSLYEPLVDMIGGIILLGTPHQGSDMQKWGSLLARLADMIEMGESTMLEDVAKGSFKTFDMQHVFMQIMTVTRLAETHAAVCFYENLPTNYLARYGMGGLLGINSSSMVRYSDR